MYRAMLYMLILCTLWTPFTLRAQGIPTGTTASIVSEPRFPQPGQSVTLSAELYGVVFTDADLRWYLHGETTPVAQGVRSIRVTAPPMGSSTLVTLAVSQPSGTPLVLTHTLVPTFMDIIFETNSVRSPFFNIKNPIVEGDSVTVAGVLYRSGNTGTPYTYRWELTGNTASVLYGQRVTFPAPDYDDTLLVHVYDTSGTEVYTGGAELHIRTPSVRIYPFINGVAGYRPVGASYTPRTDTESFYVYLRGFHPGITSTWMLNGQDVPVPGDATTITLSSLLTTPSTLGVSMPYGAFDVSRAEDVFSIIP